MIRHFRIRIIGEDTTHVMHNGFGVDRSSDGSSNKNFCSDIVHDVVIKIDHSIFGHSGIWEIVDFRASAAHSGKGIARFANVFRLARRINVRADPIRRFFATSQVRAAGIVGNVSGFLDEFINAGVVSPVTTAGSFSATIENVLDGQVDVIAGAFASDLDPIRQTRNGTMGPTTSTILGQVLVQTVGKVRNTVDITPVEIRGKIRGRYVGVR
jgi:hypothetical protein